MITTCPRSVGDKLLYLKYNEKRDRYSCMPFVITKIVPNLWSRGRNKGLPRTWTITILGDGKEHKVTMHKDEQYPHNFYGDAESAWNAKLTEVCWLFKGATEPRTYADGAYDVMTFKGRLGRVREVVERFNVFFNAFAQFGDVVKEGEI